VMTIAKATPAAKNTQSPTVPTTSAIRFFIPITFRTERVREIFPITTP
jgi:hypothetical protein